MTTELEPQQLVVLVKVDGVIGHLKVGAKQETKHPIDQPRDQAVARAYALLKRACPSECTMCWEVSGG